MPGIGGDGGRWPRFNFRDWFHRAGPAVRPPLRPALLTERTRRLAIRFEPLPALAAHPLTEHGLMPPVERDDAVLFLLAHCRPAVRQGGWIIVTRTPIFMPLIAEPVFNPAERLCSSALGFSLPGGLDDWVLIRHPRASLELWCRLQGLEPATYGLQGRCSTV